MASDCNCPFSTKGSAKHMPWCAAVQRAPVASSKDWEKLARELWPEESLASDVNRWRALKLAEEVRRYAADARAEEIAQEIEISSKEHEAMRMEHHDWWARGLREAQALARSTIKKPKTREQVLEEALKQMERALAYATCGMNRETIVCLLPVARKALEWKGDA